MCQGLAHRTPGAHQQLATGSATRTGGSTDSESSADRGRGASARAARALCSPARKGLLENDQRPEGLAEDLETGSWPVRDEGGHGACCPSPAAGGIPGREGRRKSRAAGGGFLPCLPCPVPTLGHPSGRCPYPRHAAPPSVTNCDSLGCHPTKARSRGRAWPWPLSLSRPLQGRGGPAGTGDLPAGQVCYLEQRGAEASGHQRLKTETKPEGEEPAFAPALAPASLRAASPTPDHAVPYPGSFTPRLETLPAPDPSPSSAPGRAPSQHADARCTTATPGRGFARHWAATQNTQPPRPTRAGGTPGHRLPAAGSPEPRERAPR